MRSAGLSSAAPLYITALSRKASVPRLRKTVAQLGQGRGSWSPGALLGSRYTM